MEHTETWVTAAQFEDLLQAAEWGDIVTAWHFGQGTYVVEGGPSESQQARIDKLIACLTNPYERPETTPGKIVGVEDDFAPLMRLAGHGS